MKNVILTGLMGCGKSALGRAAADKLGMAYVDMDRYIEARAGLPITRQFELYGEPYFRDLESAAARDIAEMENTLVAAGGGVVLRHENMAALKKTGFVIFIRRPPEHILADVDISGRPLLKGGASKLAEIAEARTPLYEKYADRTVQNDGTEDLALKELLQVIGTLRNPRFAVIGDPIGHSLSPEIHLPVLGTFAENPVYERVHVKKGGLAPWVSRVKTENFRGFNITMPHKADILPFLDHIDPEAKLGGSVNTVVNRNGLLYGFSTDAAGFFKALSKDGIRHENANILFLGSGGAARALALRAAMDGVKEIVILARVPQKARELTDWLGSHFPVPLRAGSLEAGEVGSFCKGTDILINTTPLGMRGAPSDWETLDFLEHLPGHAAVCDLIYRPEKTRFLEKAQKLGLKTQNGLNMLIYQALIADGHFLDIEIDCEKIAGLHIPSLHETEASPR